MERDVVGFHCFWIEKNKNRPKKLRICKGCRQTRQPFVRYCEHINQCRYALNLWEKAMVNLNFLVGQRSPSMLSLETSLEMVQQYVLEFRKTTLVSIGCSRINCTVSQLDSLWLRGDSVCDLQTASFQQHEYFFSWQLRILLMTRL